MSDSEVERYRRNLQDERDGASLYAALAAAESDPVRKDLFTQLSQAEAEHAQVWHAKLAALGIKDPAYAPSLRTRLLTRLARRFGPRFVLPSIAAAEFADRDKYAGQADAAALSSEERGHAAVVQAAAAGAGGKGIAGSEIARAEPWHRGGSGNDLRAAVLGANDGLVSNFCLVMGVAGAGTGGREILLTGLAGLAAGACSMALGEWLSVTNARELAETQIAREREEIEQTPEAEQKELALIFQAKGIDRADAQRIAAELMRDKTVALDTLAREELGIDPAERGGNPWRAAITSFALFAAGAICPVLPFLWSGGATAIGISIALSAVALAAIGFVTSLFSGRTPLYSALRQVLIGCAAAAVTYGAGMLFGVSVS
ncbi:VIT1/CCC1 transporter family protein [Solimonas flava]|uniref:VIT1/CCC1 transporter family protein n=1 Tax=Solimonas flava TaxID=415849 RepID=UPI0003F8FEDD|nr:VIT1/CCC1 transporter family protein [Solimonas flava]